MPGKFVNIDHDTPMLLPPELRQWVPEDHMVHFIMEAMGFRRFSLRGLAKVSLEWTLVSLSYNLKRLFHLGTPLQAA